jgi:hypothetical protein
MGASVAAHTLWGFRRTPMMRHVASRLEEDMVASGQCTSAGSTTRRQIDRVATPIRPCGGAALVDTSVAAAARYTAVAHSGLERGGAGAADLQRSGGKSAPAAAKSRGGGAGAEMGGREDACANEHF